MVLEEVADIQSYQRARGYLSPVKGFIITSSDIGEFLNSSEYDARNYDAWTVAVQAAVLTQLLAGTIDWEVLYEPPPEKGKPKRVRTGPWAGNLLPADYWENSKTAYSIAMRALERSRQGTRLSDIEIALRLTNASFVELIE
jgi:hypothetical protein